MKFIFSILKTSSCLYISAGFRAGNRGQLTGAYDTSNKRTGSEPHSSVVAAKLHYSKMKSYFFITLPLLISTQVALCEESELIKVIQGIEKEIKDNEKLSDDNALQGAVQGVYRSEGLAEMIQLWKAGKRWPAELAWWRSPYPNARKLAIALYYTSYPDRDIPQVPNFEKESERFCESESKQRKAEIAEVLKNLSEIKKRLEPMLKAKNNNPELSR